MQLTIVPHEETLYNIQKISLSQWTLFGRKCPENHFQGRFVLVQISEKAFYVCKLYFQREVHPSFVHLDSSVVYFISEADDAILRFPSTTCSGFVKDDKIVILPEVRPFEKVTLTVIIENISDIPKWKKDQDKLSSIVLEILKLFVITQSCIVLLKNLKDVLRRGIHGFVIHSCFNSSPAVIPGQVTSHSSVVIVHITSKMRFEQCTEQYLVPKMGGLEKPAGLLKEIIKANMNVKDCFPIKPTRQVLLIGPPGCGKTSLVRQVAAETNSTLLSVLGPQAISPKPGAFEEALRKVFNDAAILADEHANGVCILLLDELDSVCSRRDSSQNSSHTVRATVQLLTLLDEAGNIPGLVVIATTNKVHTLDPSVRRPGRLETEIFISPPSQRERESILRQLLTDQGYGPLVIDSGAKYGALVTPGYVGADLALVCQEISVQNFRRRNATDSLSREADDLLKLWCFDFMRVVSKIKPSALRSGLGIVLSTPTSIDSVGGLESIKNELRVFIEWPITHPDAFTRMGLPHPKGVLLYGPPGCAKTTIARALGSATNTTFLSVSAADLFSPYVGEAERNVAELFHRARTSSPTILFIDELDALVGCRGDKEVGAQERVLSAFLTEMDGVGTYLQGLKFDASDERLPESEGGSAKEQDGVETKASNVGVIVIAATNRPDMIDSALLRPGRFDKLLYVPAPNANERLQIFRSVTRDMPLHSSVDFSHLVNKTPLYSGADISNLCKEAALCALSQDGMSVSEISQDHFKAALETTQPSLTADQIKWYEHFKNSR